MKNPETIVKDLLVSMGYPAASVSKRETAGQIIYAIENVGDARELIGMHGDTIHAIDHLVKKIVEARPAPDAATSAPSSEREPASPQTNQGGPMFLVDIDEYRARQIKDIENKAKMMAERARSLRYDVELSPMSAYERLIVHTALQNEPNVKTESQGEGRSRRVVIKYSTED